MAGVTVYHPIGGVLQRKGRASVQALTPFAQREALTYGAYQPDANTCGLLNDPNRPLTVQTGDLTISASGTVLKDVELRGALTIASGALNVVLDNCWLRGPVTPSTSADLGVVTLTNPNANALFRDCLIDPQTPGYRLDGIRYAGYTALRCVIKNTTDGFGAFNTTGGPMNVVIQGCWVQPLAKFYPDGGIHSNGTHNDCIQLQGGSGATIIGNRFDGTLSTTAGNTGGYDTNNDGTLKSPSCPQTNACIQLNSNTGPLDSVMVTDNWMYGGILGINGLNTSFQTASNLTNLVIKRNRFDHNQYVSVASEGRIGIQPQPVITCPTSGADANVYMDTGAPVELHRGS